TNSTNRTIETGNGKIKELPWLDANDLAKTEKNIDDLRQKRLRAVGGYIVDAGSLLWKRGAPAIAKAVPQSPRPWAYLVALVPSGALGSMSRSATDPVKAMGLELSASLLHTSGLQWRLEIERVSNGLSTARSATRGIIIRCWAKSSTPHQRVR